MSACSAKQYAPTAEASSGRPNAPARASARCRRTASGCEARSGSGGTRDAWISCRPLKASPPTRRSPAEAAAATPTSRRRARRGGDATRRRSAPRPRAMVQPGSDPPEVVVRPADVHPARHDVRGAVAVEVADGERDEMRRAARDAVLGELHPPVVLEPDEAGRLRVVPVVVGAGDHDVEVAVAVEVNGLRPGGARQLGDPVEREVEAAR